LNYQRIFLYENDLQYQLRFDKNDNDNHYQVEKPMTDASMQSISARGIEQVPHCGMDLREPEALKDALMSVVASPAFAAQAQKAQAVFARLSQADGGGAQMNGFLNGWQTVHVTALYVSGLMIRMQREAREAEKSGEHCTAELLHRAAGHIGEIIAEDTGVVGIPHGALYERFANSIAGNDDWKLEKFSVPGCREFRAYVERGRLRAPVEDAILLTAASENWNTGEYTHAVPVILNWLQEKGGMDRQTARRNSAYVAVHAGDTELDHFTHALKAWQLYCAAHGREASPQKAAAAFSDYARHAGEAYVALGSTLPPARPATALRRAMAPAL
jgi:hypothetical protein